MTKWSINYFENYGDCLQILILKLNESIRLIQLIRLILEANFKTISKCMNIIYHDGGLAQLPPF